MPPSIGLDYASADGNAPPNWTAAKAAGLSFVYVRQCEGTWIDATCARDRKPAADAGVAFGGYLILRWPRKGEPVPGIDFQVAAFIKAYGDRRPGELPPALDIEFPGGGRTTTLLSAAAAMADIERAYGLLVGEYGQVTCYTSSRVWTEDLENAASSALGDGPLWIKTAYFWAARRPWDVKRYTPATRMPRPWDGTLADRCIHQIQGDAIGFPGLTSTVDVNIADEQLIASLRVLP